MTADLSHATEERPPAFRGLDTGDERASRQHRGAHALKRGRERIGAKLAFAPALGTHEIDQLGNSRPVSGTRTRARFLPIGLLESTSRFRVRALRIANAQVVVDGFIRLIAPIRARFANREPADEKRLRHPSQAQVSVRCPGFFVDGALPGIARSERETSSDR